MAEYHVGAGLFGSIYAGTLSAPNKAGLQMWRNRSDVTQEAVEAVMQHFKAKMECDERDTLSARYEFRDGRVLNVHFDLTDKKEDKA